MGNGELLWSINWSLWGIVDLFINNTINVWNAVILELSEDSFTSSRKQSVCNYSAEMPWGWKQVNTTNAHICTDTRGHEPKHLLNRTKRMESTTSRCKHQRKQAGFHASCWTPRWLKQHPSPASSKALNTSYNFPLASVLRLRVWCLCQHKAAAAHLPFKRTFPTYWLKAFSLLSLFVWNILQYVEVAEWKEPLRLPFQPWRLVNLNGTTVGPLIQKSQFKLWEELDDHQCPWLLLRPAQKKKPNSTLREIMLKCQEETYVWVFHSQVPLWHIVGKRGCQQIKIVERES